MLAKCAKCKENLPATLENFPPHKAKKNGLASWCRPCWRSYRASNRRGQYKGMIDDKVLSNLIETTKECTICGNETKLVVDHDHKANRVRGMLCNRCNQGLGQFKDDPELLEFARIYLLSSKDDDRANSYIKRYSKKISCEGICHV